MSKQFTRRHWGREVLGMLRNVLSFFLGASGLGSMLRLVLFGIWVHFLWPGTTWDEWKVKAAAVILLTLVFDTLVAKIPLADMLDALRSVSMSLAAKGIAAVGSVVTSSVKKEETVTTTSVGSEEAEGAEVPRPRPAKDGAVG